MRERDIEQALVRAVEAEGGECLKFVSPGRRHVTDRICLAPAERCPHCGRGGWLVFAEVKRPGEAPTEGQWRFIRKLRAWGFDVEVVDDPQALPTPGR